MRSFPTNFHHKDDTLIETFYVKPRPILMDGPADDSILSIQSLDAIGCCTGIFAIYMELDNLLQIMKQAITFLVYNRSGL